MESNWVLGESKTDFDEVILWDYKLADWNWFGNLDIVLMIMSI